MDEFFCFEEGILIMRRLFSFLALAALNALGNSVSYAQHVHQVPHTTTHIDSVRHGNHYHNVPHTTTHYDSVVHQNVPHGHDAAGHLTDSYGHHINGDGYHTGSIGVYENGSTSFSSNSGNYRQSSVVYSTPTAVIGGPPLMSGERIFSSTPVITQSTPIVTQSSQMLAQPTIVRSLKPNLIPYRGRGVTIVMSKEFDAEVNYLIDNIQDAIIRAGEEQRLSSKGAFEIKFSRGESSEGQDFGQAHYQLTEGVYRFAVTEKGWDLQRQADIDPESAATPVINKVPRKNVLPSPKAEMLSTPIPTTSE